MQQCFFHFPLPHFQTVVSLESLTYISIYADKYKSNKKQVCSPLLLEFQCRFRALGYKLCERDFLHSSWKVDIVQISRLQRTGQRMPEASVLILATQEKVL